MCPANRNRAQANTLRHVQRRRRDAHFGLEANPLPEQEHILDDGAGDDTSDDPLLEPVLHRHPETPPGVTDDRFAYKPEPGWRS